mmetsp:Transcript_7598/g.11866  ORF Transcript_7598/g.11866 Transcript_7598/m.11866 type:complete len:91 (+) Transcript_7598:519-791(+)
MDTTQPQLSPPLPKRLRPTRNWVTFFAHPPPTAALVFSVCGIGASLCPGSSLIPTDEKFQKKQKQCSYGALMIGSKKSRNNSCLSPAIVI